MSLHSEGTLEDGGDTSRAPAADPGVRRRLRGIRIPLARGELARAIWVAVVLAVLALAAAGWFLHSWHAAAGDPALARGRAREAVLARSEQVAAALNTEDAGHAKRTVASWRKVTTGSLHEKYAKAGAKYAKAISKAGNVSDAQVTHEALRSLDVGKGTAGVLVTIDVTVHNGTKNKTKHERLVYDMARTPGGWKAAATHTIGGR
jgi:Mce-associated membrane protein